MSESFREPQYELLTQFMTSHGLVKLGPMRSFDWVNDPKRSVFSLSRYKFVSRMFSGMKSVLEIGCGDGFASRIVAQEVGTLTATDFDSLMIGFARDLDIPKSGIVWDTHDFLDEPPASFVGEFDGVFMLDVLEHIKPESEAQFISNVMKCLRPEGCVIFGIPSLESQIYASPQSKLGHVNCKSGNDFRNTLKLSFSNVFLFSMNDEVVHTGFLPMAHYLLALCTNKRS